MGLLEENHSLESISLFCFSSAAEVQLPHYCIADRKSSFQLWQVTIIPAFILISSGKKYNRSNWSRWIFYCVSLWRQSCSQKKAKSYCDDCGIQPYICKTFCREVIWWGYFWVTLNQHPIHHLGSYINSHIPKEKCSLRGSDVKDVLDLSTDLR